MQKTQLNLLAFFFLFSFGASEVKAQSTFSEVYSILQTNCSSPYCHGGSAPAAGLDFSGTSTAVYNALINQTPDNTTAASKGHKLIAPGYPEKSFLLRKIARMDWDDYYGSLDANEGDQMPKGLSVLPKEDIELVRQWITYGADPSKKYFDKQIVTDFYNGMGKKKIQAPAAPAATEGFQVRLGSFFLEPQEEREYFKKFQLELPDDLEVKKIELLFNDLESHHFILYKFRPGTAANVPEGLRDVENSGTSMIDNEIVAAWQNIQPIDLPDGTAYFWDKDDVLDLNYHLINYHLDSILAGDVYLNIYTQPKGTAIHEMNSFLVPIELFSFIFGNPLGESLVIPNDGVEHTFTDVFWSPLIGNFMDPEWHIWLLSSHTHARGTDYDIYKRNPDGSRGEQLFEGFFDFNYTFNQGYYDWQHPPIRFFDEDLKINVDQTGLIQEAKYINNGPDTLTWGNTTKDEMMLIFVQYTNKAFAAPVGVEEVVPVNYYGFKIAPNPYNHKTYIRYELPQAADVNLQVYTILGEQVQTLVSNKQNGGEYSYSFSAEELGLAKGVYIVNLTIDGATQTKKIIETK